MMMIPRRRNEFDLFRDFFDGDDLLPIKRESAIMKTDIKEKKDRYIIEMDLPGYEKDNINLSLKDGYLEVKKPTQNQNTNYRIDPVDAMLDGIIAPIIDRDKILEAVNYDDLVDDWLDIYK
jgi:hypothetical protein